MLISQPIKHLICSFMSSKLTESIAFGYQVSKKSNTQSISFTIQRLWWYSTWKMYVNTLKINYQQEIHHHFANLDPKNLSTIVQDIKCTCGYHLSIEMDPNRTLQCRIFIDLVKYATGNSEVFKKQYSTIFMWFLLCNFENMLRFPHFSIPLNMSRITHFLAEIINHKILLAETFKLFPCLK